MTTATIIKPLPKLGRNPRGGLLIPKSAIGAAYRVRRAKDHNPIRAVITAGKYREVTVRFEFVYPDRLDD